MIFPNLILKNTLINRGGRKEAKTPPKNYMSYCPMKRIYAANPNTRQASKSNSIK
jgi:hypothetical protein